MNNNDLLRIKNKKEKFYMLRKEIVGQSYREIGKKVLKYKSFLIDNPEYEGELQNPSIRKLVLDSLEWDGFDLKDKGTQYLATLITIFFHERKLYRRCDIGDKSYWDLSDFSNEHYGMLGTTKENVVNLILNSIEKNEIENGSIEEIVYELTDEIAYYSKDRDDRKRLQYTRLLKRS